MKFNEKDLAEFKRQQEILLKMERDYNRAGYYKEADAIGLVQTYLRQVFHDGTKDYE